MSRLPAQGLLSQFDGEQLLHDLDTLGQIGFRPGGGLQRMAYGPADLEARRWVEAEMEALGLHTHVDAAGNVIGIYAGDEDLPAIAVGSHTDTVPDGGKYDGALGVLAALACVRTLIEAEERLRHPIMVIDFAGEEATTAASPTGSLSLIGRLSADLLDKPAWHGHSTRHLLEESGFAPDAMVANQPPIPVAAFLELHIEQGEQLDASATAIGIVEGIVGIRRYFVTFHGRANHAGTTDMHRRQDALVAAAPFITDVREVAVRHGIVGTVGRLTVQPGAPNVIPGLVDLDLEIRGLDNAVLDQAETELQQLAETGGATFAYGLRKEPVLADDRLMSAIAAGCEQLELSSIRMPSGAGHDAMNMAYLCPFGMLFVPSVDGISHAPDEYTRPEACVNGARVLMATLLQIDASLQS